MAAEAMIDMAIKTSKREKPPFFLTGAPGKWIAEDGFELYFAASFIAP